MLAVWTVLVFAASFTCVKCLPCSKYCSHSCLILSECCYGFAICVVIEAKYTIETNKTFRLSPQDIYNALAQDDVQDMNGQHLVNAFAYVYQNRFLFERDCPYRGRFMALAANRRVFLREKSKKPL